MAGRILTSTFSLVTKRLGQPIQQASRSNFQNASGSLFPNPKKEFLGLTKFFIVLAPSVYVGGMISMKGASLLEDYEIFVPEDDDDD